MKKLLIGLLVWFIALSMFAQTTIKQDLVVSTATPTLTLTGVGARITFNGPYIYESSGSLILSGGSLSLGTNNLSLTGSIGTTGARSLKGWFSNIESTGMPTVGGTAIHPQIISTVTGLQDSLTNKYTKPWTRYVIRDSISDLKAKAPTLHSVGFIHSDTINQAGSLKLATQYWFSQNSGIIGGGGSPVSSLSFICGVTAGAPTNGGTTVSNIAGLVNKHIEVHKGINNEGMKLLLQGTGTETFSYVPATGVITFNTALVTNDRVEIWATDVAAHTALSFGANTQLESGLLAFWNLNETSGTRQDATLADVDLSPYAIMDPSYRAGLIGNAASQSGVSGGYSLRRSGLVSTALASLNPTDDEYTVAFWYKLDSLPYVLNRDMYVFSSNISASPSSSVQVYFQGTSLSNQNKIRFKVTELGNGVPVQMTHATAVSTTGWHSVVCTAQGVGLPLKIWHDGIASTGSTNQGAAIVPATTTFNFGNYENTYSGGLTGGLDMFGLWNRAWTQTVLQ